MNNTTSSKSLELAVKTQSKMVELGERAAARMRDQRGQTAAEYLGLVVVVAVIIYALVQAGIGDKIAAGIKDLTQTIFDGGKAPS